MKTFFLVFLGGGLGSATRYGLSRIPFILKYNLPISTLIVNILGGFLIGVFYGLAQKHVFSSKAGVLFLTTGYCGGFTTFSSFLFNHYEMLKNGQFLQSAIYMLLSVGMGLAAVFFGVLFSKYV